MKRLLSTVTAVLIGTGVLLVGAGPASASATDGTRDTGFAPLGVAGLVRVSAIDAEGRVLVAGAFSTAEGATRGSIARYLPDGSLDASFTTGAGFNGFVRSLAVDSNGAIVVGGSFDDYDGTTVRRIVRLTPTGAVDPSFALGTGFNSSVFTLSLDATGAIVAGGFFTTYQGAPVNRIARLLPSGALDTSFNPSAGFDDIVHSLAVDGAGRILAGGAFTTYQGTTASHLVRLLPSGALDTTFTPGAGFDGTVHSLALDSTGRILAGGAFTTYQGTTADHLVRLAPDGTRDPGFATSGFDGEVLDVRIDGAGNVLAGGLFTTYQGVPASRIARLTAAGGLDTTFVTGTGFDNAVVALAVESSGTVVVGGAFTTYAGTAAGGIVRLSAPVSVTYDLNGGTGTAPAATTGLLGRTVTLAAGTGVVRPGHTFAAWNTAADGSGTALAAGSTRTLSTTTTVYAQWTAVVLPPGGTGTTGTGAPTLAATGDDSAVPLTVLGGVLLVAGTGALLAGRRRRS